MRAVVRRIAPCVAQRLHALAGVGLAATFWQGSQQLRCEASSAGNLSARSGETKAAQVADVWYPDWVAKNIPDMTGRVVVITGSNSGTGFWAANALASKGATVVLACRTPAKAEAAKQEILGRFPQAKIDVLRLDNMDFASIGTFCEEFNKKYQKLDLLVNNAGIMAQPEQKSKDGQDIQIQTNHLSHFLLTSLLWPKLLKAGEQSQARVVHHSSSMHWVGCAGFDRSNLSMPPVGALWSPGWFVTGLMTDVGPWKRYCMSKLCNVLFSNELQRRIEAAGVEKSVISVACHPGYASTQLQRIAGEAGNMSNWEQANASGAQSAADGSLPLLMACVSPEMKGGMYCGPSQSFDFKGPPNVQSVGGYGNDAAMAKDLWEYSEEVCGAKFTLSA